jgi:uncharacterized membrane protein
VPPSRSTNRREEKETEFARIVAFSDGVFAIAITLLVLNLSVPERIPGDDLTDALWDQRHDLFAYALSFAVIGRFWLIHHRVFGEMTGFDGRLIGLNLFYLAWIVLIPFSSQVLGDHAGDSAAVIVYAINLAAVTLVGSWMFADARSAGMLATEPDAYGQGRSRALWTAGVFLASIPVAFLNAHAAPWLWLALFVDPIRRRARRQG